MTYIKTDCNILVDTGFDYEIDNSPENLKRNRQDLTHALARFNLKVENIDLVFINHGHQDHYGNLELFLDAEVLSSTPLVRNGPIISKGVKDGSSIAEGVRVVYTPGHTFEHTSLLLETNKMRYSLATEGIGRIMGVRELKVAIAGDAVASSAHYAAGKSWNYNEDFISDQMAADSLKKIETADYIIPGHGNIFYNFLKPGRN